MAEAHFDVNFWLAGRMLGIPYLPAFADPTTFGTRVLNGVNYASAAAGILDEPGRHYVLQLMHLN